MTSLAGGSLIFEGKGLRGKIGWWELHAALSFRGQIGWEDYVDFSFEGYECWEQMGFGNKWV